MDLALQLTTDFISGISLASNQGIFADLVIDAPYLQTGDELQTAVIISLFTDRRANDDDPLSVDESRRGWWADSYTVNRSDKIGSRLWLLRRAKMVSDTLVKAREYCIEATRWFIEDNIASSVDVPLPQFVAGTNFMAIQVTLTMPTGTETFNFQYVWNDV